MEELDSLLDLYLRTFGEKFPLACCLASDEEIAETVAACIEEGEPFDPYEGLPEDVVF